MARDPRDIITPEVENEIASLGESVRQRIAWLKAQVDEKGQQQLDAMWVEMLKAMDIKEGQMVELMALALEFRAQRDTANEELIEIDDALDDPFFTDNERVSGLVEEIRDSEYDAAYRRTEELLEEWKRESVEQMADDAFEYASETALDTFTEDIADVLGITTYEALDILNALTGDGLNRLNEDEARALIEWFNSVEIRNQRERMRTMTERAAKREGLLGKDGAA